MNYIRKSAIPVRNGLNGLRRSNQHGLSSFLERRPVKSVANVGFAPFCSSSAAPRTSIGDLVKRFPVALGSGHVKQSAVAACHMKQDILRANGFSHLYGNHGTRTTSSLFARSFASKASQREGRNESKNRKEISTVEDPFDAPTYNIPEKPVTFAEGASYSVIILIGLGVAAAAAYAVFKELIFEPKEYKIFNKALKRIQEDGQVRVRIGSPITGYGQESRNRAARQRIPNRIFTDEDGVEHVQVSFYVRGPHGAGKVSAEMFKDKVDKQWKYTYLIVQIMQPSQAQLILESYMPAPAPVPA